MKRTLTFHALRVSALFTAPAWAHPGHGAPGLWHHAADLGMWVLLVTVIVAAAVFAVRRSRR